MSVKSVILNFGDPSVSIEVGHVPPLLELSILDNDDDTSHTIYLDRTDLFELIETLEKFVAAMAADT